MTGEDYWLPRLAIYTGARLSELAGLRCEYVRLIDEAGSGIPCVVIEPTEVRSVTTRASRRCVPLHPELTPFVTVVDAMRASGETRVFPEMTGKYSVGAVYSKRFGRLLRSIGITDRRKVFHSSRHTVKDKLRAGRVPVAVQTAILGHADGSVGESYGIGYPASVLLEAVSKVQYPGRT